MSSECSLVARLGLRDYVIPTLKDRHWLPVEQLIVFKLCLLMHQVHTGRAPSYLHNCVSASAGITSRPSLRSTSSRRYERQRTPLKFRKRSELETVCRHHCMNSLTQTANFSSSVNKHSNRKNMHFNWDIVLCLGVHFTLHDFVLFLRSLTFNLFLLVLSLSVQTAGRCCCKRT